MKYGAFKMKRLYLPMVMCLMAGLTHVSADEIKVGMTTALDGPAKALGLGMKMGIETYFHKVNKAGGVNGHTFKLVAIDDGYEPSRAAPNMHKLIDIEKVLAVLGNVGTPTAIVTVPIANEKKTLLYGAFTGAGVLRKSPPDRYIINYRASYAEETAAMVGGLLNAGIKPEEIAFFTQKDGYGDAGYNGGVKALKAKGFSAIGKLAHGRYKRNTLNVEEGLGEILDSNVEPKAIIMVGAYAPCAKFIKLAKQDLPNALFLNVSFVGSIPLLNALGDKGEGVIVTQVVPHYEAGLPGVKEFRVALADYNSSAKPGFVTLEGYMVAKTFVEGVKRVKGGIGRESIISGIESLSNLDIGIGNNIAYSKDEHQANHKIWPTWIKGGKFVELKWSELKK